MCKGNILNRINKMVILIIIGTFTAVELLYIPQEYIWGVGQVYTLLVTIFK